MSFPSGPASGTALGDLLQGRLLDGRYDIGERIARGGMATVYRAVDTRLDRVVALKVMHRHLADDGGFADRFVREARAAARLNDPGVVVVFDQGEDDGSVYLAMELVPGRTLRDVVREEAPLQPVRALALVARVAAALASAHAAGIVHRDVKPENVLLGNDGAVKVADFGLAGALDGGTGQSAATATGGLLIGTVSYLAPELVLGHRADARSDVYSCGIVAYELLTGSKPHGGETPIQIAYQHVHVDVPAPSRAAGAGPVPDYLDALIARATARDRDLRPTDAGVLVRQVAMVRSALAQGWSADADLAGDLQPRASGALTGPAGQAHLENPSAAADHAGLAELVDLVDARADRHDPPTARLFVDDEPTLVANGSSRAPAGVGHRGRRGLLLLVVVLMLAVAAAAGGWWVGVEQFTETPRLVRMSERQARAVATDEGLSLRVQARAYSEKVPKGSVLRTSPTAGERIGDGGTVAVTLSLGKERSPVPELVGATRAEAVDRLARAGLEPGRLRKAYDDQVAAGEVSRASIEPGTRVRPGTEVDLWVSRGPRLVTVPGVVGAGIDAATAELTAAGFTVREVQSNLYAGLGLVVQQSPDSDERAAVGSAVTIYLV